MIWTESYLNGGGQNYFLFFDSNPHVYDSNFLEWIRKTIPNSTLAIVFVNSMELRNMRDISYFEKYFRVIYTTDPADAERYGFHYIEGIHSKISFGEVPDIQWDVTFVGAEKGRGKLLIDIYNYLKQNGIINKFTIVGMESAPKGIDTKRISYKKVLEDELKSKCILEICADGQSAYTQRALEAIMYDKMLITNNKNILNCAYYHPNNIRLLKDVDDVFIKRIRCDYKCSYHYKGDFSPLKLIKDLEYRGTHKKDKSQI